MNKWTVTMLLGCALLLAAGCSRSARTNFYTLAAMAPPAAATSLRQTPSLAVDTITLPEFVDRPQLVMAYGDNRVEILEMEQWAESLKNAIPRILAENLSRQLGLDRVAAYPQHAGSDADYHLVVDFQRFAATSRSVDLDALWTVRRVGSAPLTGRCRVHEAHDGGYDSVAAAYSRALSSVSGDIARAMPRALQQ